ncbi:uncharacterized protein LOC132696511 [Cylas formicarius]|uniref:uncharacterized protein LOC132696511 n=1 Tax=Cylas formicarius TaxID=197179 RepID=UPI0029588C3A|nr:uncharacterized protein LOC132696511 [Cylas formicarius]
MRTAVYFVVVFCVACCLADYFQSSSYFCKDQTPQKIVDITQLEGIWYVLEKIIHTEERHYVRNISTCPIVHISEDRSQFTTFNPLHKTYDTTYGSGYPYNTNPYDTTGRYPISNPYDPSNRYPTNPNDYYRQKEQYDRQTTYSVDHPRWRGSHKDYIQHLYEMRYLRLYWDDYGYSTEYHLRYNVSNTGYWISSGPDGSDPNRVVGNVQVIKAVGHHLVLTFCHRLEGKTQLFTAILSREKRLQKTDLLGVHGLLTWRDLSTNAVERTCSTGFSINIAAQTYFICLLSVLCSFKL